MIMNKKKNRKSTHFYDILSNPLDNVNRGRVGIPYVGQYRIARETTQSTKHSLRVKKKKKIWPSWKHVRGGGEGGDGARALGEAVKKCWLLSSLYIYRV